jgi:hypothetical protein
MQTVFRYKYVCFIFFFNRCLRSYFVNNGFIFLKKITIRFKKKNFLLKHNLTFIQGVTEIGALILTGNRTRQKEQLFYLPFCRKTMFNSKKNWRDFSLN